MGKTSNQGRSRHRSCRFELCEPRQMLSALPMASAESISFGEVATPLPATGNGNFVLRTGIGDFEKFTMLGGLSGNTLTNGFGTSTIPAGITGWNNGGAASVVSPFDGSSVETTSDGGLGSEPPGLIGRITIDPIPVVFHLAPPAEPITPPLPPYSPIGVNAPANPISMPDPIGAPKSYTTTLPTSGPNEITEPLSTSVPAQTATALAAPLPGMITVMSSAVTSAAPAATSSYSPRWLSAAFSAAEEHRLDAQADESHFAQSLAARDPQARPALEPTRVSSQTFVVALPELAALVDGTTEQATLPAEQQEGIAAQYRSAAQHAAGPDQSSQLDSSAINDAAILDWDASQQPENVATWGATRRGQATVDQEASSSNDRAQAEDNWMSLQGLTDILNENKQMLAALAAEFAVASLWLRRQNGEKPLALSPTNGLTKRGPKDSVARRMASADKLPRLPR
jgi:hypothetical protein